MPEYILLILPYNTRQVVDYGPYDKLLEAAKILPKNIRWKIAQVVNFG